MRDLLSAADLTAARSTIPDWQLAGDTLTRTVTCASFRAAIALVNAVADVAEERDHHPDIDIRWRTVRFTLTTHSAGGLTEQDPALATAIDQLVNAAGGDGGS